jgi:hypothetical protein
MEYLEREELVAVYNFHHVSLRAVVIYIYCKMWNSGLKAAILGFS